MGGKTSGPVAPSEALHLRGIPHYLKKPQQNTFAPMPILVRAGGAQGRGWDGGQVRPPSSSRPRPCTPPLSCCAPAAPSFSTSGWGSRCIHSLCSLSSVCICPHVCMCAPVYILGHAGGPPASEKLGAAHELQVP